MRLSRLFFTNSCNLTSSSCPNRAFHVSKSLKTQNSLLSSSCIKYCTSFKAPYSSQSSQKSSNVKILTDEILKATQSKQSSDKEDESKGSEDSKKSDAFQKKAMKYTFLAFGSMFTGMLGLAIYEWGLYILYSKIDSCITFIYFICLLLRLMFLHLVLVLEGIIKINIYCLK